jgi:hypothetical protein
MGVDDIKQAIQKLPEEEIAMAPKLKPLTEAELETVERILQIDDFDAALDAITPEIMDRITGIGTDPDAKDIRDFFE